jgi:hypothetical protein
VPAEEKSGSGAEQENGGKEANDGGQRHDGRKVPWRPPGKSRKLPSRRPATSAISAVQDWERWGCFCTFSLNLEFANAWQRPGAKFANLWQNSAFFVGNAVCMISTNGVCKSVPCRSMMRKAGGLATHPLSAWETPDMLAGLAARLFVWVPAENHLLGAQDPA